jgi:hypothetical protein
MKKFPIGISIVKAIVYDGLLSVIAKACENK